MCLYNISKAMLEKHPVVKIWREIMPYFLLLNEYYNDNHCLVLTNKKTYNKITSDHDACDLYKNVKIRLVSTRIYSELTLYGHNHLTPD